MDKTNKFLMALMKMFVRWEVYDEVDRENRRKLFEELENMNECEFEMARILYMEFEEFDTFTMTGIFDCARRLYEGGYILVPRNDINNNK